MTETTYTPERLEECLRQSGRWVTQRALTDWREKGLLPALKRRSRGHGRGVIRYWDGDILERACVVHDVFLKKRRATYAVWALWFCGYSLPPKVIRGIWLKALRHRTRRKGEPGEIAADKYANEIELATNQMMKTQRLSEFAVRPLVQELIVGRFELPHIGQSKDEFDSLVEAVFQFIDHLDSTEKLLPSRTQIKTIQRLIRSFISLEVISRQIKSVSDGELKKAHRYYQQFSTTVRTLTESSLRQTQNPLSLATLKLFFAPVFGPPIYRAMLLLITTGNERRLNSTLDLFTSQEPLIRTIGSGQRAEITPDMDFVPKLVNIWKDLDPKTLYFKP